MKEEVFVLKKRRQTDFDVNFNLGEVENLNESQTDQTDQSNQNEIKNKNKSSSKSNRPKETNCSQQRLNAWKPILTPKFVFNLFLISSLLFIPIGVILLFNSNNIYEFKYDYTDCVNILNETCHDKLMSNITNNKCICRIYFYEDKFQDETLYVYYSLDNFYQNIRQYVKSVDSYQLLNKNIKDLASECEPFRYKLVENNLKLKYSPCGAIANSLFNDTFNIFYITKNTNESIKLNISKQNLAWDWDRKYKFSNLSIHTDNTINPPYWQYNLSDLESGYKNEDLMVWMRTAAFPNFRKLYGRVLLEENLKLAHFNRNFYKLSKQFEKNETLQNQTSLLIKIRKNFENKSDLKTIRLPKGQYYVDIDYRYPVKQFNGRKFFILANVSWLGGKTYFMAWAYLIVGVLCFITSFVFLFLHVYYGNMHYNTAILLVDTNTSLVK